ncbi:MAG: hypothetical protein ACRDLN_05905 [Solirubrobacteraceae bacterium]
MIVNGLTPGNITKGAADEHVGTVVFADYGGGCAEQSCRRLAVLSNA